MKESRKAVSQVLKALLPILTIVYPFVLFFCRESPHFSPIALALGSLLIFHVLLKQSRRWQVIGVSLLLVLLLLMLGLGIDNGLRLYPFMMSASMLLLFLGTERPEDNPMIGPFRERFAGDPKVLPALHRAKRIWIVGLSINSLILGVFLFAFSQELWVLYASFYSYLLLFFLLALSILYVALNRRGWL